jgi:hypothetical protein
MNEILSKVSDEDAKILNDSIVEVEACIGLFEVAKKKMDCTPMAFKTILEYYMSVLKLHKELWRNILVSYLGEEDASKYYMILRFDPVKKVIFKLNIEGCNICK